MTNACLSSQLNDLKSQHIATEVTSIDNKAKKNTSDILALENKLTQKEDTVNYLQKNHLVYECKVNSFIFNNKKILKWESTGVFNRSDYYSMNGIENTKKEMPILNNDERFMFIYKAIIFNKIMY